MCCQIVFTVREGSAYLAGDEVKVLPKPCVVVEDVSAAIAWVLENGNR